MADNDEVETGGDGDSHTRIAGEHTAARTRYPLQQLRQRLRVFAAGLPVEIERVVGRRLIRAVDRERRGRAGPARDPAQVRIVRLRRRAHGQCAVEHPSRLAVHRDLPAREGRAHARAAADDAGDAEGAAYHGGMGGRTPGLRHDGAGGDHAVHVLRAGGRAHQHHVLASRSTGLGRIRVQHRRADADAGARALAFREEGGSLGGAVGEARHEQRAHLVRADAGERLVRGDRSLAHQIDRYADGRGGGPRGVAGLQQVERALLHRELDVLDIPVQGFEAARGAGQGGVRLRQGRRQRIQPLRRPLAGDHVLPLGAGEILAVWLGRAGERVAAEEHPGPASLTEIAEHHGLNRDRRAGVVREPMMGAVAPGAPSVPRVEDRTNGAE